MKSFSSRLGIVLASLTLAAGPAFAQKPGEGAGAADRATGSNASSNAGGAVDRGGGGGGGSAASTASSGGGGGGAITSSGGGASNNTFSSPAAGAVASPSISFGDRAVPEFAPRHRGDFRGNASAYSDDGQKGTPRSSGPSGGGSNGGAVSRGSGSSSGSSGASGTRAGSESSDSGSGRTPSRTRSGSTAEASAPANNATGTREVPTWARPRGDRPTTGQAVQRTVPPDIDRDGHYTDRYGYGYGGFGGYNPYGYYGYGYSPYSAYYYPYGFGMGYGLYSGFGWAPYYGDPFGDPYGYASGGGGYSGGYATSYSRGEQGNLKLKVKPRAAKVYVDGYFVGPVDQFDGSFQKLALNTGRHKVEIKADGFETAEFDVLINPEQTVTFQGELKRIQ
jgi:hypothetical protein